MRTEKAWYWLAAGVLALGLNGAYQDGQMGWVHVIVDRAATSVERVALRGQHFVAMAEVMLGREPQAFARTQAAIERVQERIACDRIAQAQRHMAMARVGEQLAEAKIERKMAMVQMKMDRVRAMTINRANRFRNCDGLSKVTVNMPDLSNLNVEMPNIPDIQVPDIPEVSVVVDTGSKEPI
jgi:hypothetical protein